MSKQGEPSVAYEGPTDDVNPMYHTYASKIHVLLLDHDEECLLSTARMLELYSYRVSVVKLASTALLMAQEGKEHFDLLLANFHSPDMDGFQLLKEALDLDLTVIFMSTDENGELARRAIERGAYLFLQKPLTVENSMYLWQHVLRDQKRKLGQLQGWTNNDKEESELQNDNYTVVPKKFTREWTTDLHSKFMDAVNQLGEGRCYPKDIWELMNVPGLTRMQVASHLQKCRNNNWRAPEERINNSRGNQAPTSYTSSGNSTGVRGDSYEQVYRPLLHVEPQYHDGDAMEQPTAIARNVAGSSMNGDENLTSGPGTTSIDGDGQFF